MMPARLLPVPVWALRAGAALLGKGDGWEWTAFPMTSRYATRTSTDRPSSDLRMPCSIMA